MQRKFLNTDNILKGCEKYTTSYTSVTAQVHVHNKKELKTHHDFGSVTVAFVVHAHHLGKHAKENFLEERMYRFAPVPFVVDVKSEDRHTSCQGNDDDGNTVVYT